MKKYIIGAFLVFTMILTLSACSGSSSTVSSSDGIESASAIDAISSVGEIVTLGGYGWQVLDIQEGKALLIAKDIIDIRSYHDVYEEVTWEECTLRTWLNSDFIATLDPLLQEKILETEITTPNNPWFGTSGGNITTDQIFLLSIEEAVKYFGDSGLLTETNEDRSDFSLDDTYNGARQAQLSLSEAQIGSVADMVATSPTYGKEYSYSEALKYINDANGSHWWWRLRSPGRNNSRVARISSDGIIEVNGFYASNDEVDVDVYGDHIYKVLGGVRPAMWVQSSADVPDISASDQPAQESEQMPVDEPEPETSIANINWQEIVSQYTDTNGYTFEVTIKMSPWILQSNTELISSAWETVGNGNTLPDMNGWGLKKFTGSHYLREFSDGLSADGKRFAATMTDMYYSVGTISVKNVTDGWSFSSDNPGSTRASLDWLTFWSSDPTIKVISKIFYGSGDETYGGTMRVLPSMKSDKWGPVPFVIAHAELFNPNAPNGAYRNEVESTEFILMGEYKTELQRLILEIQDSETIDPSNGLDAEKVSPSSIIDN